MKRWLKSWWPILVLLGVVGLFAGLYFTDREAYKEALDFKNRATGKQFLVTPARLNDLYVDPTNPGQKILITAEQINLVNGKIEIRGPLTIDPPSPGCLQEAVTHIGPGSITVSWKCGDISTSQEFTGLSVDYSSVLITIYIVPTGARTP